MSTKINITKNVKSRRPATTKKARIPIPSGYTRVKPSYRKKQYARKQKKKFRRAKRGTKVKSMRDKVKAMEKLELSTVSSSAATLSPVDKNGLTNFIEKLIAHLSCCFTEMIQVGVFTNTDFEFYAYLVYYTHLTRNGALTVTPTSAIIPLQISDSTLSVPIGIAKYLEQLSPYHENGIIAKKADTIIDGSYKPLWNGTGQLNNGQYPTGTPATGGNFRDAAIHPNWAFGPIAVDPTTQFTELTFAAPTQTFAQFLSAGTATAISLKLSKLGGYVPLGKIARQAPDGSAYAFRAHNNASSYSCQFKHWDSEVAYAINPSLVLGTVASFDSRPIPQAFFDYEQSYGEAAANMNNYGPHNQIAATMIFLGQHCDKYKPGPAHSTLRFHRVKLHSFYPRVRAFSIAGIMAVVQQHYNEMLESMPTGAPLDPNATLYTTLLALVQYSVQQRISNCEINHINVPGSRIAGQAGVAPYNPTTSAVTVGYLPQGIVVDSVWKDVFLPPLISACIGTIGAVVSDNILTVPYVDYTYRAAQLGSDIQVQPGYSVTSSIGPMSYSAYGFTKWYDDQFAIPNTYTTPVGQSPTPTTNNRAITGSVTVGTNLLIPILTLPRPAGAFVQCSAAVVHLFFAFATASSFSYGCFSLNGPWIGALFAAWTSWIKQSLPVNQPPNVAVASSVLGEASVTLSETVLAAEACVAESLYPSGVSQGVAPTTIQPVALAGVLSASIDGLASKEALTENEVFKAMVVSPYPSELQVDKPAGARNMYLNIKWQVLSGGAITGIQEPGPIITPFSSDVPTRAFQNMIKTATTTTFGTNTPFADVLGKAMSKGVDYFARVKGSAPKTGAAHEVWKYLSPIANSAFAQQKVTAPSVDSLGGSMSKVATPDSSLIMQFLNSRQNTFDQTRTPEVEGPSPKKNNGWAKFKGVIDKGTKLAGKAVNIAGQVKKVAEVIESAL